MALQRSLPVPCAGLNHADCTAELTRLVASCEFSGQLLLLDANATAVSAAIDLNPAVTPGGTSHADAIRMGGPKAHAEPGVTAMPQDVRLSPDGRFFLVADMLRNGVWVINTATFTVDRFVHTGMGAHGIYPSRDATQIYVSNRDEGSVTVLDAATLTSVATWQIPGGGSPDMGGVTPVGATELGGVLPAHSIGLARLPCRGTRCPQRRTVDCRRAWSRADQAPHLPAPQAGLRRGRWHPDEAADVAGGR